MGELKRFQSIANLKNGFISGLDSYFGISQNSQQQASSGFTQKQDDPREWNDKSDFPNWDKDVPTVSAPPLDDIYGPPPSYASMQPVAGVPDSSNWLSNSYHPPAAPMSTFPVPPTVAGGAVVPAPAVFPNYAEPVRGFGHGKPVEASGVSVEMADLGSGPGPSSGFVNIIKDDEDEEVYRRPRGRGRGRARVMKGGDVGGALSNFGTTAGTGRGRGKPGDEESGFVSKPVIKDRLPPEAKQSKPYFIIMVTLIDLGLYVWELIYTGDTRLGFTSGNPWAWGGVAPQALLDCGAKYAILIKLGDWWRFFTPIFLHVSLLHILMNLLMQLRVGMGLEKQYGASRIFPVYLLCGVFGNLFSSLFLPDQIQAGASGSLFGFMGVLLVDLINNWKMIDKPQKHLVILLISIIISLVLGMLPGIDNFAHIGGFIMGIVSGFVFLPNLTPQTKKVRVSRICTLLVFGAIMIALFVAMFVVFYSSVDVSGWCGWCSMINCLAVGPFEEWCQGSF